MSDDSDSCLAAWGAEGSAARAARLSPEARAVHRTVVEHFVTTGGPPREPAALAHRNGADPNAVYPELFDHDLVHLAPDGSIRVAYPFSATPTAHRVTVNGRSPYAMCAIDALGVSAMLGDIPVTVTSHDPGTRQPVSVRVTGRQAVWDPATAVVVNGVDDGCRGPAADRICTHINFFTSPETAAAWAAAHPRVSAPIMDQDQALDLAVACFGELLGPDRQEVVKEP